MRQRRTSDQPDLFQKHRPDHQVRISEQAGLMPLLGTLLLEALYGKAAVITGREGNDEQDHA